MKTETHGEGRGRGRGGVQGREAWSQSEFFLQFRNDLEQVPHQAVVRDLEDGRLLVLVDGHDHLAVLHAGHVLDGPRDAHGQVQVRGHHLSGLAHLQLAGAHASINGSARGADSAAEAVSQRVQQLEARRILERAAAGDHHLGAAQVRAVRAALRAAQEPSGGAVARGGRRQGLDGGRRRRFPRGLEHGGADGEYLHGVGRRHFRHGVPCVHWPLEGAGIKYFQYI
mmetsp:Transcript_27506/g.44738  ORF Transcript_27506/g.44738 Transcript_27506/m.44738 type:complete len:226 (+) Transcript_27506:123-800(+)